MSTCNVCGYHCDDGVVEGVFTVKRATYERMLAYRYRITPHPAGQRICDKCWQKHMRLLAEQLAKSTK